MRQDSEIDDFLDMVYGLVVILLFILALIFAPGKGDEQSNDNAINQETIRPEADIYCDIEVPCDNFTSK